MQQRAHERQERASGVREDGGGEGEGEVSEPVPEADDEGTKQAWEDDDAMEGQAPTG